MKIKEFRQQHPEYDDMSDGELADKLYYKSYSDMPIAEFGRKFLGADWPNIPAPAAPVATQPDTFLEPASILSALSDEQNWYSAVPFETNRDLSRIAANQEEYDKAVKRVVSSMFYADRFDVPPETAYRHNQLFAETLLGKKDITPQEAFDNIKEIRLKMQQQELSQMLMFAKADLPDAEIEAAPLSLFGNAFLQALAGKPAAVLRGIQVYTPGEALGLDPLLQKASEYLESLSDPEKKAKVEKAAAGRLWPTYEGASWHNVELDLLPETINAWAATIGDQIPIMLMTWAGRTVGVIVGAKVGAVVGAGVGLITGGPEPTDVITVPAVAAVTAAVIGHLGGAAPLIGMEAGYFMDRATELNIDKDIAEKYARWYGLGSGTIEYAQWLWNLKAFKRLSPKAKSSILKKVFGEIGGGLWEGFEELSQQGLENKLIGEAIKEQQIRTPDFAAEIPEIWAGGKRAFAVGLGVSLITRAPGHVYTSTRKTKIKQQIQGQTDATDQEAELAVETIAEGGPLADQVKQVVTEQAKAQAPEPVVPEGKITKPPVEEPAPAKQPWEMTKEELAKTPLYHAGFEKITKPKASFRGAFYLAGTPEAAMRAGEAGATLPEAGVVLGQPKEISQFTIPEESKIYGRDVSFGDIVVPEQIPLSEWGDIVKQVSTAQYSTNPRVNKEAQRITRQTLLDWYTDEEVVGDYVVRQPPTRHADLTKSPRYAPDWEGFEFDNIMPRALRALGYDAAFVHDESGLSLAVVNPEVLAEYPELAPPAEGKVEPTVTEQEKRAKKLRQKIHAVKAVKGLTDKAFKELKRKITKSGLAKTMMRMDMEELEALLKKVQQARPKRIGYKRVITKKTENKIQSLKEALTRKQAMTDTAFADILQKEVGGRTPSYTDAQHFITETEGKDIIRRMLNAAEIIQQTEPYERAIAQNAEIAQQVAVLDEQMAEPPKRDPWRTESMRYYAQQMELKTGAPIFTAYMDLINTHNETTKTRTARWATLEAEIPNFKEIAGDDKAIQRVTDYIAAQTTLKAKPESPKDITPDELKLAKAIQQIFKDYEIKVRTAKFFNWYFYQKPIAEYDQFKTQINKAVDIYESQGREALEKYLQTQTWGIIKSGYSPLESIIYKIRMYDPGMATVGKSHINIRTSIDYHTQERNLLQRLSSYMRQMDMLYSLSPKINAFVQLVEDNLDKFNNPRRVESTIEGFLKVLKKYDTERGFFERIIARVYAQAMTGVIMAEPVLAFRNTLQPIAFVHDKSTLINPQNKTLSAEDLAYVETHVLQMRQMIEQWFMVYEKSIPGFRWLTKLARKLSLYPWSDTGGRYWTFWAKINQVRRSLEAQTTEQMMTEARFKDMSGLAQRRALAILAKDGKDAMARYVARTDTDNVHFLYGREQRSPAEMTTLGRVVGNLFLFPRAYTEKMLRAANKMMKGKTHQEQWRGLKIMLSVIVGGMIIGGIFKKIVGRRRNPYNPLNIFAFRPGGLAWAAVDSAAEISNDILSATQGDKRALAALAVSIPQAADMFIPFYDITLRGIEAATDTKNIDRKALRQIRMLIDNEYKIRGGAYKLERTTLEKWKYIFGGAGVDVTKKEQKKKGQPVSKIKRL